MRAVFGRSRLPLPLWGRAGWGFRAWAERSWRSCTPGPCRAASARGRFQEVLVTAGLLGLLGSRHPGGVDDHVDVRRIAALPDPPTELQAVDSRHLDVGDHALAALGPPPFRAHAP